MTKYAVVKAPASADNQRVSRAALGLDFYVPEHLCHDLSNWAIRHLDPKLATQYVSRFEAIASQLSEPSDGPGEVRALQDARDMRLPSLKAVLESMKYPKAGDAVRQALDQVKRTLKDIQND